MNTIESISLAFSSIGLYKLRAFLTLLSISIGVFAIMGSCTLTHSIDSTVSDELADLGENSFLIRKMPNIVMGHSWRKYWKRKPITFSQLNKLKQDMSTTDLISGKSATGNIKVKSGNLTSDPDVNLIGTDENYFNLNNISVDLGRVLDEEDLNLNRNVAVIGNDIVVKIFPNTSPLGKKIYIKNQSFVIIGVTEKKGAILGQSQDNIVIIPINMFLKHYAEFWNESLEITMKASDKKTYPYTLDEAIGIMRSIRDVQPWEENTFEIETNESISEQFSGFTSFLTIFGGLSGIIALIAAGVGIMNIMLVSVKERTREIGVRKAVGAKKRWIMTQFIIETITLCQIGGLFGILFGLLGGWGLGAVMGIDFSFPLKGLIWSVLICTVLGILFGAYPAWKASKLDPIEALRYE